MRLLPLLIVLALPALGGCALFPDVVYAPQYHNPFPQLHKVAILPFFNLSGDPTVNGEAVAVAYYTELQQIPGFEVMPVGVVRQYLAGNGIQIDGTTDFQRLARDLGVDVIVRGAVTEFSPYYPPRIGLAVDWFAANPSFHPIPAGYGLPWGTTEEEFIPSSLVYEAEFALAREQLKTQTPAMPPDGARPRMEQIRRADHEQLPEPKRLPAEAGQLEEVEGRLAEEEPGLPWDWPDPRGFIPPPPSPERPRFLPQPEPIITHTRLYFGNNPDFTERLAKYFYLRDDARFGGWQAYLQRSDDFIQFCCYVHLTDMLAARGGVGETRVVWRWPIGRYDR